ncbi:MAG: 50S ribosomal protein L29 [Oscillospiraceae bacterium]|jgi:large subunit ribosomal protein L29|nr:50S ribosomal protein L29 [Oscillospiraceae bacterium]
MKSTALKDLSEDDLQKKIKDLKSELFNLRFQHSINQLENPMRIRVVKKEIARVLTIVNSK